MSEPNKTSSCACFLRLSILGGHKSIGIFCGCSQLHRLPPLGTETPPGSQFAQKLLASWSPLLGLRVLASSEHLLPFFEMKLSLVPNRAYYLREDSCWDLVGPEAAVVRGVANTGLHLAASPGVRQKWASAGRRPARL